MKEVPVYKKIETNEENTNRRTETLINAGEEDEFVEELENVSSTSFRRKKRMNE